MKGCMEKTGEKIHTLLKRAGMSQSELARRIGVTPQTIQSIVSGNTKKSRNIVEIANILKVRPEQLTDDNLPLILSVPIVGVVYAGTSNIVSSMADEAFDEIDAPENATKDTVAVLVKGDSMGGRLEPGDHVFYDDRRSPPTADMIGELCVVEKENGEVLVKRLSKGAEPDLFHLISYNAEPEFNQRLRWAARITWIKPGRKIP